MNTTVASCIFIILIMIGILYTTSTRYYNNKYNVNNSYESFNLLNSNDINTNTTLINPTLTDNMQKQTGGYPQLFKYNYDLLDSTHQTTEYRNMHFDMYSDIIYLGNNL